MFSLFSSGISAINNKGTPKEKEDLLSSSDQTHSQLSTN